MSFEPNSAAGGAIPILRHALQLRPDDAELYCELAGLLHQAGETDEAVDLYRRAVMLDPRLRRGWYNLGCLANQQGREADGVDYFLRSIELDPDHAPSRHNLGQALFNLGDTDGAIAQYRAAIALGAGVFSETMLAMTIAVSTSATPQEILQTRKSWAMRFLPPPMHFDRPRNAAMKNREKPIRVGYVSAYFDHPNWMKPVWGLVNRHDRERFALFFYSDGAAEQMPRGYRRNKADQWRWTGSLGHEACARRIAADELDLLVDLNGFSVLPRLGMFALRPARVQAGWFNMFATTGSAAFDYLIGDETVVAEGEKADYSERVVRLPGSYLTFEVDYPVPDVQSMPSSGGNQFTFGSLASLYKITPAVIALWAKILERCPESQLLLRNSGLRSESNRRWLRERFVEQGIAAERLLLEGPVEHFEFLRTYDRIDLALDPFPYNGGTTTSEALWQGVPVVAMRGDRWTSRVSASLLGAAGLERFIAADTDQYVAIAAEQANDLIARKKLSDLRGNLRDQLRASSVCDVEKFARRMETAYRSIVEKSI